MNRTPPPKVARRLGSQKHAPSRGLLSPRTPHHRNHHKRQRLHRDQQSNLRRQRPPQPSRHEPTPRRGHAPHRRDRHILVSRDWNQPLGVCPRCKYAERTRQVRRRSHRGNSAHSRGPWQHARTLDTLTCRPRRLALSRNFIPQRHTRSSCRNGPQPGFLFAATLPTLGMERPALRRMPETTQGMS
jgi:hypothetical protein